MAAIATSLIGYTVKAVIFAALAICGNHLRQEVQRQKRG